MGTDQEGSSLHGRWWCPQLATRVGLCVEGLSMIMTRPGPLASPPVHYLNRSPTPGASQTRLRRCVVCGVVMAAVWVVCYDMSVVGPFGVTDVWAGGGGGLGLQLASRRR